MKNRVLMLLPVLLLFADLAAAEGMPTPNDFAYGSNLDVSGTNALYEAVLPPDVYTELTRADQSDLCVFNGQGEVVPFTLRQPIVEPAKEAGVPLRFFPILAASHVNPDNMSLQIRKDSSGSIISVDTKEGHESERKVVAYLLDAGSLQQPIKGLDLEWEPLPESFIGKVSVSYSDDLESWSPCAQGATIAGLHYGGQSLDRRTVAFGPVKARYFRLTWPEGQQTLQFMSVVADPSPQAVEQPRKWAAFEVLQKVGKDTAKPAQPDDYYFDAGGFMPVDRVRVHLPQKNTMAEVSILSRSSEKDEWKSRQAALVYDLYLNGEHLVNPDITVRPSTDRYWLVRIAKGGVLGKDTPRLELGWTPQELIFLAQGDGPFTLAYGSAKAEPQNLRFNDLLTQFTRQNKEKSVMQAAQVGSRVTLGGSTKLLVPTAHPWKQWILWSVLVLGVALLAWMALYLYKQMSREDAGNP